MGLSALNGGRLLTDNAHNQKEGIQKKNMAFTTLMPAYPQIIHGPDPRRVPRAAPLPFISDHVIGACSRNRGRCGSEDDWKVKNFLFATLHDASQSRHTKAERGSKFFPRQPLGVSLLAAACIDLALQGHGHGLRLASHQHHHQN